MSDYVGPCDHCGGQVGARGWMIAVGMSEDHPIVEVACSEPCRDAIAHRMDPSAQAVLRHRVDVAIAAGTEEPRP